jgi:hypothetical protein
MKVPDIRPVTARHTPQTNVVPDDARALFSTEFFAAVRKRDAAKVREMAKQAGAEMSPHAARPLIDFLVPPSSSWKTPRHRKRGWPEARAAAVWALGRIGDPAGFQAIARTLVADPDFTVRAAAAAAIEALGSAAIPALACALREKSEWQLDGMRSLVAHLGSAPDVSDVDRKTACAALADVLYDNFPLAPKRWTRSSAKIGRSVASTIMCIGVVWCVREGMSLLTALFVAWLAGAVFGVAVRSISEIVIGMMNSSTERKQLYPIAARSIVQLDDKRAIPWMLQAAFETGLTRSADHARTVLRELLPKVGPDGAGLLSAADIECINGAILKPLDEPLVLGMLCALKALGNGTSMRSVQRLARRGRSPEVRAAAAGAMEAIREREARLRVAQSLLRGASAPAATPGEMLRAASDQPTSQPDELLRATFGEQRPAGNET